MEWTFKLHRLSFIRILGCSNINSAPDIGTLGSLLFFFFALNNDHRTDILKAEILTSSSYFEFISLECPILVLNSSLSKSSNTQMTPLKFNVKIHTCCQYLFLFYLILDFIVKFKSLIANNILSWDSYENKIRCEICLFPSFFQENRLQATCRHFFGPPSLNVLG